MSGASLLEVQSLTTILPAARGQLTALRDVSFSLQEGEILGLVGESGSGKSVTLKSLLQLLPADSQIQGIFAGAVPLSVIRDTIRQKPQRSPYCHDFSGANECPQPCSDRRMSD
jgi:ABC-type dipeptide/oligopeptide/nickel transport system ATPase component